MPLSLSLFKFLSFFLSFFLSLPPLQFSPHHPHSASHPETINKTVLTFDIQLYNSTAAGLGITVCGKTSTTKKAGDKGIYIKSVTPRGAAAMVRKREREKERERERERERKKENVKLATFTYWS